MGTLIILAILALVVLGFNNPLWWFAGAALLYLHFRYGRTGQGSTGSSAPRGPARRHAATTTTARTVSAVTSRPGGSAATAANAPG